jgi:hypothetical protein
MCADLLTAVGGTNHCLALFGQRLLSRSQIPEVSLSTYQARPTH